MSAQLQAVGAPRGASEVEESFEVAVDIARRGYAMPVIKLAVVRKGLVVDSADVVAILALRLARQPVVDSPSAVVPLVVQPVVADIPATYEGDKALAAAWALRGLARFLLYAVLALGEVSPWASDSDGKRASPRAPKNLFGALPECCGVWGCLKPRQDGTPAHGASCRSPRPSRTERRIPIASPGVSRLRGNPRTAAGCDEFCGAP